MMKKKKKYLLLAAAVVLLAAGGWAYSIYRELAAPVLTKGEGSEAYFLFIGDDDNADSVLSKLAQANIGPDTDNAEKALQMPGMRGLRRLFGYYDYDQHIRTGRYGIEPGRRALDVFRQLRNGQQTPVMLTVPEVRTMTRMAARLSAKLMLDSATIAQALTSEDYCRQLGYDTATIACLFVPNTYEVWWNTGLDALMERMQK